MRVLIYGSSRVIERITLILKGIGADVASAEKFSKSNKKMIVPELALLCVNSEGLENTYRDIPSHILMYLFLDGYEMDWARLGQMDVCGYIPLNVGDCLLKAYLKAIMRRIMPDSVKEN